MLQINVTNLRKNIFNIIENVNKYNSPVQINTKDKSVYLISEEEYRGYV